MSELFYFEKFFTLFWYDLLIFRDINKRFRIAIGIILFEISITSIYKMLIKFKSDIPKSQNTTFWVLGNGQVLEKCQMTVENFCKIEQ